MVRGAGDGGAVVEVAWRMVVCFLGAGLSGVPAVLGFGFVAYVLERDG